jgi:aquaporin Z
LKTNPASHWVEYCIEGAGLGIFMISASSFAVLLEHPASPVHQALPDPFVRRALMGLAMGLTAVALIYSPWGQRSGAHLNPAVTLTFCRLGKVAPRDLVGYIAAQFLGGALGMAAATALFGPALAHASVNFVLTRPGASLPVAFAAEFGITAFLMTVVLHVSNHPRFARFTGLCAGACVALFITFEAPLSGMSLNPARSLASALAAQEWTALWLYFFAPPLGMLTAAAIYTRRDRARKISCAKLDHPRHVRCIFCEYHSPLPKLPTA